jgi:hypothetical protein
VVGGCIKLYLASLGLSGHSVTKGTKHMPFEQMEAFRFPCPALLPPRVLYETGLLSLNISIKKMLWGLCSLPSGVHSCSRSVTLNVLVIFMSVVSEDENFHVSLPYKRHDNRLYECFLVLLQIVQNLFTCLHIICSGGQWLLRSVRPGSLGDFFLTRASSLSHFSDLLVFQDINWDALTWVSDKNGCERVIN